MGLLQSFAARGLENSHTIRISELFSLKMSVYHHVVVIRVVYFNSAIDFIQNTAIYIWLVDREATWLG